MLSVHDKLEILLRHTQDISASVDEVEEKLQVLNGLLASMTDIIEDPDTSPTDCLQILDSILWEARVLLDTASAKLY